jgi:hypothetical protein
MPPEVIPSRCVEKDVERRIEMGIAFDQHWTLGGDGNIPSNGMKRIEACGGAKRQ